MPRILCLSAYDAGSHRRWYQALSTGLPEYDWHILSLPPRHFRWRIRGNPLSWLDEPLLQEQWDLIIATTMVDLSVLRGLHPSLAGVPALVYCHENQFFYPSQSGPARNAEPAMVNLYGALAADQVLFNSAFNRDSFMAGVDELMQRLPDLKPRGLTERLRKRSAIVPVPLDDGLFTLDDGDHDRDDLSRWGTSDENCIRLVWAARWEYDKGPNQLLAVLQALEARGVNYRLCLLGERFRKAPEAFARITGDYSHRLSHAGYVESRQEYLAWLRSAQLVLSTSLHEFQGLAVLEAVACGCVPVLPDRLVYPEYFPAAYRYASHEDDVTAEAESAAALIVEKGENLRQHREPPAPSVEQFAWRTLAPVYREVFDQVMARGRRPISP